MAVNKKRNRLNDETSLLSLIEETTIVLQVGRGWLQIRNHQILACRSLGLSWRGGGIAALRCFTGKDYLIVRVHGLLRRVPCTTEGLSFVNMMK